MNLPKLTMHAIDLPPISLEELVAKYADGCVGMDAREAEATVASVIFMFMKIDEYPLDFSDFKREDQCIRLRYACNFAFHISIRKNIRTILEDLNAKFMEKIAGNVIYPLFPDFPNSESRQSPHSREMGLDRLLDRLDIYKMIGYKREESPCPDMNGLRGVGHRPKRKPFEKYCYNLKPASYYILRKRREGKKIISVAELFAQIPK